TINIGVAGIGGRGGAHINEFCSMKGVRVTYLIDTDKRFWPRCVKQVEGKGGNTPKCVQDVRKALEDKDLNAISIATPNHWHSLMSIWACQAGKDVYVEKPCSHNIHEGRILVETARKYGRIVQHGTQQRTGVKGPTIHALVKKGVYGKLLASRGLCYKAGGGGTTRGDIGAKELKEPPPELDFDLWLGPAPRQPYHENIVHYRWHWFWDFGNGDIGNQGVHEMDIARWVIPGATLPKSVVSVGLRYPKDQGQTPNSMVTVMDFGETQLIFEVRGLPSDAYFGEEIGNILHFEAGVVKFERRGSTLRFYPKGEGEGQLVPKVEIEREGAGDRGHFANFIAAVRSRKVEDLNAPIIEGHLSAACCHLPNISYRVGEDKPFTPRTNVFGDNKLANESLERMEQYFVKNGAKLDEVKLRVGKPLRFDPATEKFVGNEPEATALLTRKPRPPFVVPDKVV
ncbi:Gfo/Idh/MocA family oxidoreductase, partial [Candidatus Sumerlaeota bacterium]|nr:Gfo/Idh/MocA family oxidoreductase [Candidatus Sumerlaeota bacterium]